MCGHDENAAESSSANASAFASQQQHLSEELLRADEPFPWHLGVYDAHCHLAERVLEVPNVRHMRVRGLAVMATRTQDQHLVADIARQFDGTNTSTLDGPNGGIINGHGNGTTNGTANGAFNGTANGTANGTTNGTNDAPSTETSSDDIYNADISDAAGGTAIGSTYTLTIGDFNGAPNGSVNSITNATLSVNGTTDAVHDTAQDIVNDLVEEAVRDVTTTMNSNTQHNSSDIGPNTMTNGTTGATGNISADDAVINTTNATTNGTASGSTTGGEAQDTQDGPEAEALNDNIRVVPGFGRHPWFSHEVYDDTAPEPSFVPPLPPSLEDDTDRDAVLEDAKRHHYKTVLIPAPSDPAVVRDLPAPIALTTVIADIRRRLRAFPNAVVGEIGIDRAGRLPVPWDPEALARRDPGRTPGGREGRPLSSYRISITHQVAVFKAQLKLAGEMRRPVSIHNVQTHAALFDILASCSGGDGQLRRGPTGEIIHPPADAWSPSIFDGPLPPELRIPPTCPLRVCLLSFSGQSDTVMQFLHRRIKSTVYFSFSKSNNMRDDDGIAKMRDALTVMPDNRVLVESDLKSAGQGIQEHLEMTCRAICEFKGWQLAEGVAKLAANYQRFIHG